MTAYENVQAALRQHPRRWLVTGAAGFIGSHLAEALLKLDQTVVGLDNFSTGDSNNLGQVRALVGEARWRRFHFIEGDIRSLETCRMACREVDFVLHQAALGSVPRSIEDPLSAHENNVTGFFHMLMAAQAAGVTRFVYAGSSAAYGDDATLPKVESRVGRPLSPYAATKYIDEVYADVFARCYGLETVGLRYFNVYGPRQDPNGPYASVIPKWIANMLRREPVYINGDGTITRDFCYVENVVQANLLAASATDPAAVNQIYNIALNESTSLSDLFILLRALLEPQHPHLRGLEPIHREFRKGDMAASRADIGKAMRLLGYRPDWRVRDGLERTLAWYVADLSQEQAAAA